MRLHGMLAKWNEARGFGFIARDQRDEQFFVHISAFPKDGIRPRVGEMLSFEIAREATGKTRAVDILRPGRSSSMRASARPEGRAIRTRHVVSAAIAAIALVALGLREYPPLFDHLLRRPVGNGEQPQPIAGSIPIDVHQPALRRQVPATESTRFSCDGRTYCSQMTSCAEATFFLRNCPNVKMDGDGDGIPCEAQFCGH